MDGLLLYSAQVESIYIPCHKTLYYWSSGILLVFINRYNQYNAALLSLSVPVEQMLASHFQESILSAPSNGSRLFQTYPSLASTEAFAYQIHVVEHHSGNSIP